MCVFIFLDAFLKVFLKFGLLSLQHCSVELGDFPAKSFLQTVPCTERMSIHACFGVSPQEIFAREHIKGPRVPRNASKPGKEAVSKERTKNVSWCLAEGAVASTCWNHTCRIGIGFRRNSGRKKLFIISTQRSQFTATAFPLLSLRK